MAEKLKEKAITLATPQREVIPPELREEISGTQEDLSAMGAYDFMTDETGQPVLHNPT